MFALGSDVEGGRIRYCQRTLCDEDDDMSLVFGNDDDDEGNNSFILDMSLLSFLCRACHDCIVLISVSTVMGMGSYFAECRFPNSLASII